MLIYGNIKTYLCILVPVRIYKYAYIYATQVSDKYKKKKFRIVPYNAYKPTEESLIKNFILSRMSKRQQPL